MVNRMQSYVGVSGVVSPEQQASLVEAGHDQLQNLGRRLALGVKATHKPQFDDQENKYGRLWYPVGNEAAHSLHHRFPTFNIAQTYLEPTYIEDSAAYPQEFMTKISARMRDYLDAVQIDLLRFEKDPERYAHVFRAMADTGLQRIVQCHGYAMEEGPKPALESLKKLIRGRELNYILFDASHGRGQALNADALLPFIEAAYADKDFADMGTNFGVAGGLNPDNLEQLLPKILQDFPEVSWDAEGQLHDAISEGGDGSLNMERTRRYLVRSAQIATQYA